MKTKPFLLATAGSTVDGRTIDGKQIDGRRRAIRQIAAAVQGAGLGDADILVARLAAPCCNARRQQRMQAWRTLR